MTPALRRLLRIQPGEGPVAARMLGLMVVAWIGASIGANGVESLFFVRFGPEFLPYLYVALGLVTLGAVTGVTTLMGRMERARFLVYLPLLLAVVVFAMRASLWLPGRWIYPVLWLAMMVVWTVQLLTAWTLAGTVHETRQAKRLFPLYGSGLIVGAVVGGLGTGPLARLLGTENLALLWAGTLLAHAAMTRSVLRAAGVRAGRRRAPGDGGVFRQLGQGFRAVRESRLLRWMALSLSLFALLYFSLALLFAEAATARFPRADGLAGFLGLFMGACNGAALLVSLLLANRLFARFGVPAMVLVLPVLYLVGFAVLMVAPAFTVLVAFRLLQMTWVNGVWATGWQALFNVVPSERRDGVRAFMDGIPLQAGVVASGVVLILAQRVLAPRDVALIGAGGAVLAAAAMWRARRSYGPAVVEALRGGDPEVFVPGPDPFGGPLHDAAAVQVLLDRAADPDPVVRRICMEIMAHAAVPAAAGAVRRGLDDPDAGVRAAAARASAQLGGRDLRSGVTDLLDDPDGSVRTAAVRALGGAGEPASAESIRPLLSDGDPSVRAWAARAVADLGGAGAAEEVLREMTSDARPDWREAALVAFRGSDLGPRAGLAALEDPHPSVRLAAVAALGGDETSVEASVRMLADSSEAVREAARELLVAAGPAARDRLLEALGRPDLETEALLALSEMRSADPALVRAAAERHVREAVRYGGLLRQLGPGDGRLDPLRHGLRYRGVEHAMTALRAEGGLTDPEAMRLAIGGLGTHDPVQRANALEALEAVGEPGLVRPLLELWEAPPGSRRGDPGAALVEAMSDRDPWLRACAAWAAGKTEDGPVREAVVRLASSDADTLVRRAATAALGGEDRVEAVPAIPLMERVVFLRKVPLFADLEPPDLKAVAEAVSERAFPDGETIAVQGEPGEELYIVVEGEIRVVIGRDGEGEREVARRGSGEYVGEMAILGKEPRMASLVCAGTVRVLALDQRRFQRILRERPDASLAVMRVLSARLRESYGSGG